MKCCSLRIQLKGAKLTSILHFCLLLLLFVFVSWPFTVMMTLIYIHKFLIQFYTHFMNIKTIFSMASLKLQIHFLQNWVHNFFCWLPLFLYCILWRYPVAYFIYMVVILYLLLILYSVYTCSQICNNSILKYPCLHSQCMGFLSPFPSILGYIQ